MKSAAGRSSTFVVLFAVPAARPVKAVTFDGVVATSLEVSAFQSARTQYQYLSPASRLWKNDDPLVSASFVAAPKSATVCPQTSTRS